MRQYTTFLFDWDGTLADSTRVWFDVLQGELAKHGLHPTEPEILTVMGDFAYLAEIGLTAEHLPAFEETVRTQAVALLPDAPLFAGATDMLAALREQGRRLAVVTSTKQSVIHHMLEHHRLGDFFDVVVSGSDVAALKPDPEAILLALKKLATPPSADVLMAGDAGRDIQAAHNAGVDSLLFYPPEHAVFHDLDELQKNRPTHLVTDWRKFPLSKPTS